MRGPGCLALLLAMCCFVTPAWSQSGVNPEIANCREISDPATQTQAELCAAWAPCNFVLGIQKVCTKARTFLDGLKNLSWGERKPDTSDFFDAAAPLPKGEGELQRISRVIREKYASTTGRQTQSGEFEGGTKWHYEGGMQNGRRHGVGVLVSENGNLFRGEFVEGRQAGLGEMVDSQSRKAGVMMGAKLDGFGVEHYPNGNFYQGEFRAGLWEGQGTVYWKNGERFDGVFKTGNIDSGNGTWYMAGNKSYRGQYVGGRFDGFGVLDDGQGWIYDGQFKAGKKEGQGVWRNRGGAVWSGEFRNDLAWNVRIVEADGRSFNMTNGKAVITTQVSPAQAQSDGDDVDWAKFAQGLSKAAGAYVAAMPRAGNVAQPTAPLPPVQYKPYGTPAPVAPPGAGQANSNQRVYYPMLTCVSAQRTESGGTCAKNNCGKLVTVYWQSAQTGVGAGSCYPTFNNFGSLLGACESGDSFDKSLRMCRK